ncbi:MAG TPA: hypothetical protein H9988_03335 [Candidatus Acutalibacter stercoravium]|nr:hypothetical protein [Candidatus Acutalibacter stercoravium]
MGPGEIRWINFPLRKGVFGLGSNFFREILAIAFSVLSIRRKQESFQQEAEARRQGSFLPVKLNSASGRCPVSQNGRPHTFLLSLKGSNEKTCL